MAVRLKNRWQSPIAGFQFVDAAISAEPLVDWGFDALVALIIQRRQANPRFGLTLNVAAVQAEVDLQNALRMQSIRGGENFIVQEDGLPAPPGGSGSFTDPHNPRRSVVGDKVKAIAAGASLLLDWLGAGGETVPQTLAESRAQVCASCPQNQPGDWTRLFTEPAANKIKQQLSLRAEMELKTTVDDQLRVCKACLCPLPLKVLTPLKHILEHTSDAVKTKLDPQCWVLSEK